MYIGDTIEFTPEPQAMYWAIKLGLLNAATSIKKISDATAVTPEPQAMYHVQRQIEGLLEARRKIELLKLSSESKKGL